MQCNAMRVLWDGFGIGRWALGLEYCVDQYADINCYILRPDGKEGNGKGREECRGGAKPWGWGWGWKREWEWEWGWRLGHVMSIL